MTRREREKKDEDDKWDGKKCPLEKRIFLRFLPNHLYVEGRR